MRVILKIVKTYFGSQKKNMEFKLVLEKKWGPATAAWPTYV